MENKQKGTSASSGRLSSFSVDSTTSSANTLYQLESSTTIISASSTTPPQHTTTVSINNVDLDPAIHIGCTSIGWNISVDYTLLEVFHQSAASFDVYLGGNSCRGSYYRNFLFFDYGFQDCLTNEKVSQSSIIYENTLIFSIVDTQHSPIVRHHRWTYIIECDAIREEATSFNVYHDVETNYSNTGSIVHNDVSVLFYDDPNFMDKISGNPLHVVAGQTIYAKVFATTADWSIKMRLHSCYIRLPSIPKSPLQTYMLIQDGCEVDANTHIMSQSTHETTFMFQNFGYSADPEGLDVYCNATFCPIRDFSTHCLQSCNIPH